MKYDYNAGGFSLMRLDSLVLHKQKPSMSRRKLAESLGTTTQTICNWEDKGLYHWFPFKYPRKKQ